MPTANPIADPPKPHSPCAHTAPPRRIRRTSKPGVRPFSMQELQRLLDIMARLRDPEGGCPWDLEQSFATIAPYTVEEAYEVADAIQREDMADLRDELGDLLFQVVYHAQMAGEAGEFQFADVAEAIADKIVRRHPHVFGDAQERDATTQTHSWEAIKAEERASRQADETPPGALDGVSLALPGLTRAVKLQSRAARVGFDWGEAGPVLDKIREEIDELQAEMDAGAPQDRVEDELGDLFFACANLARHLGVDPEAAVRRTNAKFERRFGAVERQIREAGGDVKDATLEEMESAWQAAKRSERKGGA